MLKVFLVEDEVIIREGIKNKINWAELGLTFVGEASDGELAYPLIQNTKPDILITDIKMPFMDGLALGHLVKQEMPNIKIIILSGYSDFEYAKEAIGIGVSDYLLKPISSVNLTETLLRIKKIIEDDKDQKRFLYQYEKELHEHRLFERNQLFRDLVSRKLRVSEILEKARMLRVELSAQGYNIILFHFMEKDTPEYVYSKDFIQLEEKIQHMFSDGVEAILFNRDLDGWGLLLRIADMTAANDVSKRCAEQITTILKLEKKIQYFLAVSNPVRRLQELPKCFEDASRTFAYRYLMDKNLTVFYDENKSIPIIENENISLTTIDTSKFDRKIVGNFLKSGSKEDVSQFIDGYFESTGNQYIRSFLFRQYVAIDVHLTAAIFLQQLGLEKEKFIESCGDMEELFKNLNSLEDTRECLIKILTNAIALRDLSASGKYIELLEKAKKYIKQNYSHETLSLNQVSQVVSISPAHFSTVFSQEMGITFIEYVTNIRMEKAKELLRCSGMKSSEIGYAIGYKDPHYFSYLFKKLHGCTPKEFRMGKADVK